MRSMTHSYNTALTYDDIQLVPQYSDIISRSDIDLTTQLSTNYKLKIPIIASPMDTVCESTMAIAMAELGGVGCIHRFMTIEDQVNEVDQVNFMVNMHVTVGDQSISNISDKWNTIVPIMAAVGANGDFLERSQELVKRGANVILIDVAHGYHKFVRDALKSMKETLPSHVDIIAGNIATADAAETLRLWGADGLRVGIGGGSLCTTRVKTGFGVPNITSLQETSDVAKVPVIACGGIRSSGDIAKALAVGASSVILGSLLAGTKEAPGAYIEAPNGSLFKKYRGAASLETKSVHGLSTRNVEGEQTLVPFKGGVKFIVEGLMDGLRSALSYAGASSLDKFAPSFRVVTNAGISEARPHLL